MYENGFWHEAVAANREESAADNERYRPRSEPEKQRVRSRCSRVRHESNDETEQGSEYGNDNQEPTPRSITMLHLSECVATPNSN
jgi:hypothetical protein